jgi:ribosome-binding factor A
MRREHNMSTVPRMTRVNELLKRELADLIRKNVEYSRDCLVTVTEVQTTPDLRHAKVFISILGKTTEEEKKDILKKIGDKRSVIQEQMSSHVTLKYTPVLEFKLDTRIEAGDKVLAILQELEGEEKIKADSDEL